MAKILLGADDQQPPDTEQSCWDTWARAVALYQGLEGQPGTDNTMAQYVRLDATVRELENHLVYWHDPARHDGNMCPAR